MKRSYLRKKKKENASLSLFVMRENSQFKKEKDEKG